MSGALKTVGQIAGIASIIPGPQSAIFAVIAVVASIGAQLTAERPPVQGSATEVTIGANMASPYLIGEAFYAGSCVHQVGYGTERDVPNAYLGIVDVHSVAGPVGGLINRYLDFTATGFSGTNAVGYYHDHLHTRTQLGATNEASALTPIWSGMPDWSSASKLSGKAAILWNAIWTPQEKVFSSGFPQRGALWQGVLCYDPRLDSTYPGGSGSHRWASPSDKVAFAAARATWTYSRNPGLHALRYALGSWERDEDDSDAEYRKVFGIGGAIDQVVIEDYVEHANVCDANSWTVNGPIFESGAAGEKWSNLKRILIAGGAEPVFKGARLGLKINAPRLSLDTITMADIAEGEVVVPGTRPYSDRKNTLQPYFISADHKWQSVPTTTPVQVLDYVAQDGEEKPEDLPFDLVTVADQAAQLAGYELVGRREQGPIAMPLLPRLRIYPAGVQLAVDAEVQDYYGIQQPDLIATNRTADIGQMSWSFAFVTETEAKHDFALGLTASSPPAPTIVPPEEIDGSVGATPSMVTAFGVAGGTGTVDYSWTNPTTDRWDHVELWSSTVSDFAYATDTGETISTTPGDAVTGKLTGLVTGLLFFWAVVKDSGGTILTKSGPLVAYVD